MSRRHVDPIEVRTRPAPAGPVPEQFLWHGRLYLVREVLARWTESGSWWRGAGVRAMATGATSPERLDDKESLDDVESQWWRVEADSGRRAAMTAGPGVYDLCFEERTAAWTLKRVMD